MKRLNQAFKRMESIEPPTKLESGILCDIKKARTRQIRQELIFSEVGLIGSMVAVFYTLFAFGQTLLKSEFWGMLSLFFSDWQTVAVNFYDFTYSLMETFPVLTLAIILVPLFTLFLSASAYFNLSNNKHKYI